MISKSRHYFYQDNISAIFLTTAMAMIFTEATGVIAVLIDGIIASQFLGEELYAGMSLLRPFTRIILVLAGFFAGGCAAVCSRLITQGKRRDANGVFNLAVLLALAGAAVLILFCLIFPETTLRLCGVPLSKSPELVPYMYEYLHGYLFGVVPLLLIQVTAPILVMDGGRRIFFISTIVLCVCDIAGDLLNVFVYHGGAFGIGVATSVGFIIQMLIIVIAFFIRRGYFHPSFIGLDPTYLNSLLRLGLPDYIKRLGGTLREVLLNYINIVIAVSFVAVTVRGIQGDLAMLMFCIPSGMGRALGIINGVYYRAKDRRALERLYAYGLKLSIGVSIIMGILIFVIAPLLTRLYTHNPEFIGLTIFSIRWMAVGLMFDTSIVLHQGYLQSTGSGKVSTALIIGERLFLPVAFALVLGMLFGTKGVLASYAVSRIFIIVSSFLINCVRCHGVPKEWRDIMLLPEDFGGTEEDNIYAEIRTMDDAVRESKRAYDFCLQHYADKRVSTLAALFVEEMAGNVVKHAKRKGDDAACVNYRLFADRGRICFNIMDRGDRFDPAAFYEMYHDDSPEKHVGIRMVMNMAKEVLYFNTYSSNNLTIYLDTDSEQ